jgi:hypothetical protein
MGMGGLPGHVIVNAGVADGVFEAAFPIVLWFFEVVGYFNLGLSGSIFFNCKLCLFA